MTASKQHPQRCTAEDIESISQFIDKYKDGELFFYSKKTIRRMVLGDDEGRKPYDIFLSRDNGNIVGIAIVSSKSKTLSLLFVEPEYRNRGIGKELYAMANPKQILAKRKAIPYFAMLEGCVSHSSQPVPETIIGKQTHEAFDDAKYPVFVQGTGWITKTDAERMFAETAAKAERERVLQKTDDIIYAMEENGEEMSYENIMHELDSLQQQEEQR